MLGVYSCPVHHTQWKSSPPSPIRPMVTVHVQPRNSLKYVTFILCLKSYHIDATEVAKVLRRKLATGASVLDGKYPTARVELAGNQGVKVKEFLVGEYQVPEECVEIVHTAGVMRVPAARRAKNWARRQRQQRRGRSAKGKGKHDSCEWDTTVVAGRKAPVARNLPEPD